VSDARIERGTAAMLELRRSRLAEGDRPLGWKVGFGSPAAFELLGTDRPLVGFLTDRTLLPDGAAARVGDWATPMLEAEVAVRVGADAGIDGYAVAIELADLSPPPEEAEAILSGNIFHKAVLLGPFREPAAQLAATLTRDGEAIGRTDTPTELTGEYAQVVEVVREAAGDELKPGDVIITGSIFPPVEARPGDTFTAEVTPLGSLSVRIAA
jgi:2-keto-4-pentenoate hydratase